MLPIAATGMNGQVQLRERPLTREEAPIAEFRVITPGYLQTMGIALVAGRYPDARDTAATGGVVVVNETLARDAVARRNARPCARPADAHRLRRRLDLAGSDWRRPRRAVAPHGRASRRRDLRSRMRSGRCRRCRSRCAPRRRLKGSCRSCGASCERIDPTLPLAAVRTFQDVVNTATRSSQLYSVLTGLFGALAAVLAILGIYSVMSYTVAQRTRELAIRSALGASHGGLLQLVLREGFIMSAIGIAAGLAGALSASQLVRALLYQVSPTDPIVLTVTAAIVAAAAALGYLIPALRASRVAPVIALRAE